MDRIIVAGCGTGVGKTIVSAILMTALQADYWKPIQSGEEGDKDTKTVRQLCPLTTSRIHSPAYDLKAPLSPHHAARLEGVKIDLTKIIPPDSSVPLIIESVGGVLVPLNHQHNSLDLFQPWKAHWILVSRHYLGSINHTLLTVDCLRRRGIQVHALIFNGEPNPDSEEAILTFSQTSLSARLLPETEINHQTITRYASLWRKDLQMFF